MNLKQSIEQYLHRRSARLAPNTIKRYRTVLNKLSGFVGADLPLANLSNDHIADFQLYIKGRLCLTSQRYYADILRTFFKYWVERRESDVIFADIQGPRKKEHIPNFITQEQFEWIDEFLDADEYYQLTQRLIFNLLWDTGMRIGELLSLNVEDIDIQARHVIIHTEKTGRLRVLMWSEWTHDLLVKYLGVRLSLNQAPELFQTPPSPQNKHRRTRLTARSVQRWCKKLGKEFGFEINPHAFRHGKMRKILLSGGKREDIQVVAGHSSINSSEVYVRLNVEGQMQLQQRFLSRKNSLAA